MKFAFSKGLCSFRILIIIINFFVCLPSLTLGQFQKDAAKVIKTKSLSDSLIKIRPPEKLYLQFDKPYYALGDTIWFKAYLFHAPTLSLSNISKIMYVDITNDSNTYVKQFRLPVKDGITWGNISLDDFPAGNYTVRAYTNWMRNFGPDCFFTRRFLVADVPQPTWHASSQLTTSVKDGKPFVNLSLQLSNPDKTFLAGKPVLLELMSRQRRLLKQVVTSDANGMLDVNFKTPENSKHLTLVARDEKNENSVTIPINLNSAENLDVQFLPEGGNLVAGLPTHVAFKALDEDGRGTDVSGIITDHAQNQVATFLSVHNGMGSFDLSVLPGEVYTAKVKVKDGSTKEYPLPKIKATGTILNVINPAERDSLTITVSATDDIVKSGEGYFLIGKSRGVVCYAAVLDFKNGNSIRKNIAKHLFPTGITHFILSNQKSVPLNERLAFINHNDNLKIKLECENETYVAHDSVAVHINVADNTDAEVSGNFSMAVTDDAQVKPDSINNENILTHMLLTNELSGYVEAPGYYLQTGNRQAWAALDNLLLTQGWVNFDWQEDKQHPAFAKEEDFEVKGKVINAFNNPVKGTRVTLLSKTPLFARDTTTDDKGNFIFRNFAAIDTPVFFLKAVNKHEKSFNVAIVMGDSKPPQFTIPAGPTLNPWYFGLDTALIKTAKNNQARNEQKYYDPNSHLLKEVKITAKKVVKGSQNLNGPGEADLVLDEADMIKAAKKTWLDILKERVKGFHEGNIRDYIARFFVQGKTAGDVGAALMNSYPGALFPWFFVDDKPLKFIIDGIPFGSNIKIPDWGSPNITDIEGYLQSHNAEDIKGIEVNNSTKYSSLYVVRYIPGDWGVLDFPSRLSIHQSEYCFIEITTRSGKGPFNTENAPGTYLYKPIALSWPKQFYKPRYTLSDRSKRLPDLRSTINWEPNVNTDKNGQATVSFFAADSPSTYTVIIEGTDGNGNLGYKSHKINIVKPVAKTK